MNALPPRIREAILQLCGDLGEHPGSAEGGGHGDR
jgi:hypothetical protein